jgi:uncharacterized membrane protein YdjX (TVP38/TMEM64 family)
LLAAALIGTLWSSDLTDAAALQQRNGRDASWAPLSFIALFAVSTFAFVPGSIMTLAGGLLFGPLWGTVYNLVGATVGASLSFLFSRYVAADWVHRRSQRWLTRIMASVEAEGWRFVAFARLVSLIPFFVLNYALGLT